MSVAGRYENFIKPKPIGYIIGVGSVGASMRQIIFRAGTVLIGTMIYVLIGMALGTIG